MLKLAAKLQVDIRINEKIAHTCTLFLQTSLWYMNGFKMDYNIHVGLLHFLKYHEYPFCRSQPKFVHLICGAYILFMENVLDVHSAKSDKNDQNWLQNIKQ